MSHLEYVLIFAVILVFVYFMGKHSFCSGDGFNVGGTVMCNPSTYPLQYCPGNIPGKQGIRCPSNGRCPAPVPVPTPTPPAPAPVPVPVPTPTPSVPDPSPNDIPCKLFDLNYNSLACEQSDKCKRLQGDDYDIDSACVPECNKLTADTCNNTHDLYDRCYLNKQNMCVDKCGMINLEFTNLDDGFGDWTDSADTIPSKCKANSDCNWNETTEYCSAKCDSLSLDTCQSSIDCYVHEGVCHEKCSTNDGDPDNCDPEKCDYTAAASVYGKEKFGMCRQKCDSFDETTCNEYGIERPGVIYRGDAKLGMTGLSECSWKNDTCMNSCNRRNESDCADNPACQVDENADPYYGDPVCKFTDWNDPDGPTGIIKSFDYQSRPHVSHEYLAQPVDDSRIPPNCADLNALDCGKFSEFCGIENWTWFKSANAASPPSTSQISTCYQKCENLPEDYCNQGLPGTNGVYDVNNPYRCYFKDDMCKTVCSKKNQSACDDSSDCKWSEIVVDPEYDSTDVLPTKGVSGVCLQKCEQILDTEIIDGVVNTCDMMENCYSDNGTCKEFDKCITKEDEQACGELNTNMERCTWIDNDWYGDGNKHEPRCISNADNGQPEFIQ